MKIVADVTLGEKLQEENPNTHEIAHYFEVDPQNVRFLVEDPKFLEDYKKGPGKLTITITQSGSVRLDYHSLVDDNPDEAERVFREREESELRLKREQREAERKRVEESGKPDKDGFITSTSPSGAEVKIKPGATVDLKDIPGHGVNMDSLRDASQPSTLNSGVDQKELNSPARTIATPEGAKERFSGNEATPSVEGEPTSESDVVKKNEADQKKSQDDAQKDQKKTDEQRTEENARKLDEKESGDKKGFDPLREPKK